MLGQHGLEPRQQLGDSAALHHDCCGERAAEHLGVVAACLGAQRRRLGTEPLGLFQVAAEQGLHAVEERDVPPVERRPELLGDRREPLDLLVHFGRPELEQRHHPEAPRRQGHLPVARRLRDGEHLRRGAQPGLGVRRPRLHVAPGAQCMGQGGPIVGLPGEPHGLVAPLLPVCRRGEVGRRDRTSREQARAQLGVVGAEQGQRHLEQAELAVVPEPHLEATGVGSDAQRGQGQEVGAAEAASEVCGPREGVACGLPVTAVQVRVAQTEQQVRLLLGLGTRCEGPLELLGGRLEGARRHRVPGGALRGQDPARGGTVGTGAQLVVRDGRPAHVLLAPAVGQDVGHPAMEGLALPGRELRGEGGPDQGVRELVLGPADRLGQPRPGRLLQQPGDDVGLDPAHLGQQRHVEAVPDDGGRPQQLVAGLGEPGQSPVEHRAYAGRQRERPTRGQVVPLGLEQPGDVQDEERVAAGVVADARRAGRGLPAAGTPPTDPRLRAERRRPRCRDPTG